MFAPRSRLSAVRRAPWRTLRVPATSVPRDHSVAPVGRPVVHPDLEVALADANGLTLVQGEYHHADQAHADDCPRRNEAESAATASDTPVTMASTPRSFTTISWDVPPRLRGKSSPHRECAGRLLHRHQLALARGGVPRRPSGGPRYFFDGLGSRLRVIPESEAPSEKDHVAAAAGTPPATSRRLGSPA